jgi:hypothetical protein
MPFRLLRAERAMAKDTPVAMRKRSAKWRKLTEEAKALTARMQDAVSKQTMSSCCFIILAYWLRSVRLVLASRKE